jgi:hypothetical protein
VAAPGADGWYVGVGAALGVLDSGTVDDVSGCVVTVTGDPVTGPTVTCPGSNAWASSPVAMNGSGLPLVADVTALANCSSPSPEPVCPAGLIGALKALGDLDMMKEGRIGYCLFFITT